MNDLNLLDELCRVLTVEAKGIEHCIEFLQLPKHSKAVTAAIENLRGRLDAGGRILVSGVGKSGKIGQKLAATFSSTGSPAYFVHPIEALHGDIGFAESKDIALLISYSGNSEECLSLLPALRSRQIPVLALTREANSQLASIADGIFPLPEIEEACPLHLAPTTSTTLTLAFGDAVAVTLMKLRGFEKDSFAKNHPGGALGKRLCLQVTDVMKRDPGEVRPETQFYEVLVAMTEKNYGGVLVTENDTLVGLITEGDIRRTLLKKEELISKKASDIMTRNPVTVKTNQQAFDALKIMEDRETKLSLLPVVDDLNPKKAVGVLQLHDLLQIF